MHPTRRAPWLASELQKLVIEQADRITLKQCRLVNKAFNQYATVKLFRELHVTANIKNYEHRVAILEDQALAACVQKVILHDVIVPEEYKSVDAFRRRVTWLREGHDVPLLTSREMENLFQNYCQALLAENQWRDEVNWWDMSFLGNLPNAHVLECRAPPDTPYDPRGFAESRIGLQLRLTPVSRRTAQASSLEQHDGFTSITIDQLKLTAFEGLHYPISTEHLRELHCYFGEPPDNGSQQLIDGVDYLTEYLDLTKSLRQLTLAFGFLECDLNPLVPLWKSILTCHWPQLRCLDVRGVVAEQSELTRFFSDHSHSLRRLKILNIYLQDSTWEFDHSDASVIGSFFYQLRSLCKLEAMELAGLLLNGHGQGWCAQKLRSESDASCYRAQVENYICHRGPSPAHLVSGTPAAYVDWFCEVGYQKMLHKVNEKRDTPQADDPFVPRAPPGSGSGVFTDDSMTYAYLKDPEDVEVLN